MERIRISIFASGNGTNAQTIFRRVKGSGIEITSLVCDNPDAKVIGRARSFQIPIEIITYGGNRQEHEREILSKVEGVDWILLAGYMRILSSEFVNAFYDKNLGHSRIVNIHPSLLPKYPGLNSYERAYRAGDVTYGPTLHFVDEGVDTGKIIEQARLERKDCDTLDEFIERGMRAEYQLYSNFIDRIVKGEI